MNKEAFIHGFYPHSEDLIAINRGVDKGRFTEQELKRSRGLSLLEFAALQRDSGFSYIEDGKFRWQDIFRPLIESAEELEEGPLTRWFDTNTFYRKFNAPVVSGSLKLKPQILDSYITKMTGLRQKITLPSPYFFAKACDDRTTTSFSKTYGAISDYLGQVVQFVYEKGVDAIQLNEPFIPYAGASDSEIDAFVGTLNFYNSLKNHDQKLFLQFDFGNAGSLLRNLEDRDIAVDGLGANFCKTVLEDVPTNVSRPLIVGIINSQNSPIQSKEQVEADVDDIAEHTKAKVIYLTNSTDLSFVSKNIADQKLKVLGEIIL